MSYEQLFDENNNWSNRKSQEKLNGEDSGCIKSKSITKKNNGRYLFSILTLIIILMTIIIVILFVKVKDGCAISKKEENCTLKVSSLTSQNLYQHSAIASDAVPCASVANNMMSVKGGNAVDGAIAGLLCTCSVNFHSCGIGGGSFVLIYNKTRKQAFAIDLREMAPGLASENMYQNDTTGSRFGGKSIAVMGLISGYYEIHKAFGRLDWKTLFEPSIDILNKGFYISKSLEKAIDFFFKNSTALKYDELRNIITDHVTGKPKKFGDIIKIPKLAKTMEILSNEPYAMKNGSLIKCMMNELKSEGALITETDFLDYETKWRTPISVNIGKHRKLYTLPPPSSGVLVAFSLKVLSEYEFGSKFLDTCENTGLFFHRFIETMKFAYAKKSELGDMDFVNVTQLVGNLTSDSYCKWIKSLITDDQTHPVEYYMPSFEFKEDHGTSHFSLISPDGDAVSVTSTINYLFGSLVMGNETGIVYNDEMDDFSSPNKSNVYDLPPSPSNFIKPHKRPMSTMSPIILVDNTGNVELVAGSSGGSRILSSTSQIAVFAKLLNKGIKESIDSPRAHHQLLPNEVFVENHFPESIIEMLRKRGHVVTKSSDRAVGQGIKLSDEDPKFFECNADYRKMGLCDGF